MATGSAFGITAYDPIMSSVEGWVNSYFDKKAEKRAYKNQLKLMAAQYEYAQRYAENTPSWNVTGLRNAGLNPILAANGGSFGGGSVPSAPSVSSHRSSSSNASGHYDPLTLESYKGLKIDNESKRDMLQTQKAENEVKRLRSEAEASLLRPSVDYIVEGDGKSVGRFKQSDAFKALQKSISDNYDLGSEKYMRETIDKVMKYGLDVLKLLPAFRKQQVLETMSKSIRTDSKGRTTTHETYTTHGPKK